MMENKKQLVVVPPLSDALQKLQDVLQSISGEENMEISTVDDQKELNQFIGSAGQSLILFSNAKKCALFLQENRFLIAKSHSKIILLTPKEIPAKTMTKFVKLGLTEALLESSPPKTLLYKVKLLVRSIKSSSLQNEEKDQVIKSMLDLNAMGSIKREAVGETENDPSAKQEEAAPEVKKKADTTIELIEGTEGKNKKAYVESAIETNWKTKKKTDAELNDIYGKNSKVETKDDSNIDIYYRGKKKISETTEIEISPGAPREKENQSSDQEEASPFYPRKTSNETVIDLHAGHSPEKSDEEIHEEEDYMELKPSNELTLDLKKERGPLSDDQNEEEKAEAKKKEFDELEALFEAARAKASEDKQVEDLGGYLKGKVTNEVSLNFGEDESTSDGEKEDSSSADLYEQAKKSTDISLSPGEDEKKKQTLEERLEILKKRRAELEDRLSEEKDSREKNSKKLTTLTLTDGEKEKKEAFAEADESDWMTKSRTDENTLSEYNREDKIEKKIHLEAAAKEAKELDEEKEGYVREDANKKRKDSVELQFDHSTDDESDGDAASEDKNSKGSRLERLASLESGEETKDLKKSEDTAQNETMGLKKVKNVDITFEDDLSKKMEGSSIEKIDTYYRSGEAKKTDFSWDNLTGKGSQELSFGLSRNDREQTLDASVEKKDLGEIYIDYRKMREEFDHIARHGSSSSEDGFSRGSAHLNDSDDAGTFKVIELNARGFLFSVEVLNLINARDSKPQDFYKKITEELINSYHGYPVFYTYKTSDNSHTESFDSFAQLDSRLQPEVLKNWWNENKKNNDFLNDYFQLNMTTWICRDIPDAKSPSGYWQDVELPSWAEQELATKKVELAFPYYDGLDKMGLALVFFPEGLKAKEQHSIMVTLELLRTVMLETIQRTLSVKKDNKFSDTETTEAPEEENKVTSLFKGLFGRNKAS